MHGTGPACSNPSTRKNTLRTVTVYSQPHCQPCKATKRWLNKNEVPFNEVDITTSPDDAEAIRALGFKEAPVVIVSTGDPETDLMWSGFIPDNLRKYTITELKAA